MNRRMPMIGSTSNKPIYFSQVVTNLIVILLPLTVLLDWMEDLGYLAISLGLYTKAFSLFLFLYYLVLRKFSGFHFKKILLYFLSLNILYSLLSDEVVQNLYFTIRTSYWIFGSIVLYQLIISDWLTLKILKKMMLWTVYVASIFSIILMQNSEEHQNASAYLLLWCLPILLLFKPSFFIRIAQLLAIVAILVTIKRGAMIALIVSLGFYVYGMLKISRNIITKTKILLGGILLFLITGIVIFFNWQAISTRLEDKSGSGRDVLYSGIINRYINGNSIEILFGYGVNSVQEFSVSLFPDAKEYEGVTAHSDWLQYIHDFGVLGILFMFLMHFNFIKLAKTHYNFQTRFFPIMFMAYSIFFLTTIYSFILNTPNAIFIGIILAVGSAELNKIKLQN